MTKTDFQIFLKNLGFYKGNLDGDLGPQSETATRAWFEAGPDTRLTDDDYRAAASRMGVTFAQVKAIATVESAGDGFNPLGMPKILPERHVFWKELSDKQFINGVWFYHGTDRRRAAEAQGLAYEKARTKPYPSTQAACYDLLVQMIKVDPAAALASASWGKFQIMGNNFAASGFANVLDFVDAMTKDEIKQLAAFEAFHRFNGGKGLRLLKQCGMTAESCAPYAAWYNGPGFAANEYDRKIAKNIKAFS